MIDPANWMTTLAAQARDRFGGRLLFMGLQGSYRRGEATEASDIDVVTVLDVLTVDDLRAYRELVAAMPEGSKACGFIGGGDDLRHWPRHELFCLAQDTVAYHGRLETLLPPISRADIAEGVRLAAGNLYHMAAHTFLYADPTARRSALGGLFKALFFVMQPVEYLKTGVYATSKRELLERLAGDDRELFQTSMRYGGAAPLADPEVERHLATLLAWAGKTLRTEAAPDNRNQ